VVRGAATTAPGAASAATATGKKGGSTAAKQRLTCPPGSRLVQISALRGANVQVFSATSGAGVQKQSEGGRQWCVPCERGRYSAHVGKETACEMCPPGKYAR
jgi:hypothetical protein